MERSRGSVEKQKKEAGFVGLGSGRVGVAAGRVIIITEVKPSGSRYL